MFRRLSKPVRAVVRWQLVATAVMTLAAALLQGVHGAISAGVGGFVSICAGVTAAFVAARSDARSAGGILVGALRAEAIKIGLAVLLLWLVLQNYDEAMVGVLIGSFIVTMLIFTMAFFVREY
jgi:ATP synthase protein I